MTEPYLPFYSERRCLVCGQWRRQHHGESTNHHEMLCPLDERGQRISKWFGHTARFFPGPT